jgi:hypothetical protein
LAIIATILVLIVALTYYGIQVGNFVITIKGRHATGLSLCVDEDNENLTTKLVAKPLKDCLDADLSYIPEDIDVGLGSKNSSEGRYLAYSFYLVNSGKVACNYTMKLELTQVGKNLDDILRVMIIHGEDKDKDISYYARKNKNTNKPEYLYEGYYNESGLQDKRKLIECIPFTSDDTIIQKDYYDLSVGTKTKFTIVMWLCGWDEDEETDLRVIGGSGIKTQLTFSVLD